jgi:hypothetical protein
MIRIDRIDEKLQSLTKPNLEVVSSLVAGEGDLIIISAGFEDRALETLNRLFHSGSVGFTIMAISYLPHVEENRFRDIEARCSANGIEIISLVYNRPDPLEFSDAFMPLIDQIPGRILIDVSAMSRLLIVQIIVALKKSFREFRGVAILYTEASVYPPTKEEVNSALLLRREDNLYRCMFLSSGVFEVIIVPELASVALQGQPMRLVFFPSFNSDQLQALLGELQPVHITLIHGRPPRDENVWRLESIKKLNQTERILRREDLEASTLDYVETLSLLLNIYSNHGATERLVIAPTGSKMQAVAVGIFRAFMDDVQVVYPVPRSFPTPSSYTIGVKQLYCMPLDVFSNI